MTRDERRDVLLWSLWLLGVSLIMQVGCDTPSEENRRGEVPRTVEPPSGALAEREATEKVRDSERGMPAGDISYDELTWADAESVLTDPEVATIAHYYSRLSKVAKTDSEKRYFSEKRSLEDFDTLATYLGRFSAFNRPGMTEESAKGKLANELTWKGVKDRSTANIKRVYTDLFKQRTAAEYELYWGIPVYLNVFADVDGVIQGWVMVGRPDAPIEVERRPVQEE